MHTPLVVIIHFFIGTLCGVFLTTCIERLPFDEFLQDEEEPTEWYYHVPIFGLFLALPLYTRFKSLLPASRCPACRIRLRWFERIPILSFIAQHGRCRTCGFKIPGRHPLVEISAGVLFAALAGRFGLSLELMVGSFLALLFIIATVVDLRFQIIPDEVNMVGLLGGLVLTGSRSIMWMLQGIWQVWSAEGSISLRSVILEAESSFIVREGSFGWGLAGFLVGSGSLMLLYYVGTAIARTEAMGGGDVKLAGFIGLFLGPRGVMVALFWSTLLGAAFGVFILLLGLGTREDGFTKFAFGPYICAGALTTFFVGVDGMIEIYMTLNSYLIGFFVSPPSEFVDGVLF